MQLIFRDNVKNACTVTYLEIIPSDQLLEGRLQSRVQDSEWDIHPDLVGLRKCDADPASYYPADYSSDERNKCKAHLLSIPYGANG